ncbi:hypothetical protein [Rhodococcus sp. 27YEA6]|uniref:hypothetical protein n=1 Tax=Rhodococcus sp. 27YEA6 TaxID=3156273 RepID=UPI00384CB7D4
MIIVICGINGTVEARRLLDGSKKAGTLPMIASSVLIIAAALVEIITASISETTTVTGVVSLSLTVLGFCVGVLALVLNSRERRRNHA